MIRLQHLRKMKGWSMRELWKRSGVDPSIISYAENRGFRLYDGQLKRLAVALEYAGDPHDLLDAMEE